MAIRKIKEDIFNIGAIDWDRELFDELIPLPEGTSYNAYVVFGSEKIALIDAVEPEKEEEFLRNLKDLNPERIDYIVSNHAEQDHSGLIPQVLERYPEARIVTNEKCKGFLMDLLPLKEDAFHIVADNQTLSLGNKTLEFIIAPWVHWPETMFTYLREDRVLFSGDFLGSHLALSNTFSNDDSQTYMAAKRYFAEIMMPFRPMIKKHLQRLEAYDIQMVCAVHGPVYKNPSFIINHYKDWVSDDVKNLVLIPYVSMHGSTLKTVEFLTDELTNRKIEVLPINMTKADLGKLTIELVDAATIVLASSTVLVGPHPQMLYTAAMINALRPKTKNISIITSYGWASQATKTLKSLLGTLQAQWLETIDYKGYPKEGDLERVRVLAEQIAQKHRMLNLL
ncbi:MAG TPA: FprA family A-type flavoprotein [Thermotogota bacterium]|nr:FprA family A-type flavoprotein [Thermotogota bacterium]HRW33827.1 FprA family A-type flavoprotein [Thermotogota bacterium]